MTNKEIVKWKSKVVKSVEDSVEEKRTNGKPLTFADMEGIDDDLTYKRLLEEDIRSKTNMKIRGDK